MHNLRIALVALLLLGCMQTSFAQSTQLATDSLVRSQICSRAAREYMKRPEWEAPQLFDTQSYTSHYNNKLNKCLVSVRRSQLVKDKDEIFEMNHVYDAIEGRVVGGKLLTKRPIGADPKVVRIVLLKGERFVRDPVEAATVLLWFDNLMED
jgi:hypothetical protein